MTGACGRLCQRAMRWPRPARGPGAATAYIWLAVQAWAMAVAGPVGVVFRCYSF